MNYTIQDIAQITGGELRLNTSTNSLVEHIVNDSRKVLSPSTSLFIALPGKRRDGHDFIGELYKIGVRQFLVSQQLDRKKYPKANWVVVPNTLSALQGIAQYHRKQFDFPVIGITGSNGKTIVKEWLFQLLHTEYNIIRSPQSFNSQLGVPLSVWQMHRNNNLGIFEAGISQKGEMANLAKILEPTIGIFTNIGDAHSIGFDSYEEKILEKLILFKNTEVLIYRTDDETLCKTIEKHFTGKTLTWSLHRKADINISSTRAKLPQSLGFKTNFKGKEKNVEIPFNNPIAIENAIHAWVVGLYLGISDDVLESNMSKLTSIEMRLELKAGSNNCLLINDSYSADINALASAFHLMDQQGDNRKKVVILSDFLESGYAKEALYLMIGQSLIKKRIDRFIGLGEGIKELQNILPANIQQQYFNSTDNILQEIDRHPIKDSIILLKGARVYHFEKIAQQLTQKFHQTTLTVNLNALRHNLNVYAQQLQSGTHLMLMLKAAAYGAGSVEIARLLEEQTIHYFAVAYTDEGIALRQAGIEKPILVLNPEEASLNALITHNLEPEIYSILQLKRLIELTTISSMPFQSFSIHLNIDTGMNRLGLKSEDISELLNILKYCPSIKVASIFTHLAVSESPEYDNFTCGQVENYLRLYDAIVENLPNKPLKHVLNSAGISRFPQYQFDMVRLGMGLYGYDSSFDGRQSPLETIFTLKANIAQIKHLKKGDTVGYGRKGLILAEKTIATVNIGYADGLLRKAGNGRFSGLLHGIEVPTIGNICMDMCMMDISAVTNAKVGDEVTIFGANHSVDILANCLDTIPYEIFTSISERVKRIYIQE